MTTPTPKPMKYHVRARMEGDDELRDGSITATSEAEARERMESIPNLVMWTFRRTTDGKVKTTPV